MEKNRLFIVISSAAAILGSFLPWYTTVFGVISISGIQNSGWIVIVISIGSIVLACLNNINTPLNKTFSTIHCCRFYFYIGFIVCNLQGK